MYASGCLAPVKVGALNRSALSKSSSIYTDNCRVSNPIFVVGSPRALLDVWQGSGALVSSPAAGYHKL